MTTYRHPEYGKFEMGGKHIVVTINDCYGAISTLEIPNHIGLLALGFEEVEEEKDWIDSAIQEMEKYFTYNETGICLTSMPPQYPRYNKTDLRQVIEKYMPKQKKFTIREVEDYYRKIEEGLDKGVVEHNKENKIDVLIISAITGFLRDHDLLEE